MRPPYVPPPNSREAAETFAAGYECPACHAKARVGKHVRVTHEADCPVTARLHLTKSEAAA